MTTQKTTSDYDSNTEPIETVAEVGIGELVCARTLADNHTYNQYRFQKVCSADSVRGEPEEDGVVYVSNGKKYYPNDDNLSEVPDNVIEQITQDYTLYTDVDAGWSSWAGRPEFDESQTYVDVSDAQIVGE
ncbi:hypothetical protein [Natrinema versiforme]|uniref:Uncharacterized protein n=1 Tax=Natrinema versiforme TaxID=88724 RepID=A0A4P8WKL5_9EURY|nr:hypothetical protein [Natrinema versiforme]QCS43884.1 hypothetical protein FEJ81_16590 [Natrinema versiforme]